MKKNIIIGLLIVITLISITYGSYQKIRADRNETKVKELEIIAHIQKTIANMNAKKLLEQHILFEKQKRQIVGNEHKEKQKE
jgi:hypothetical protein